jgi:hypothetical protein
MTRSNPMTTSTLTKALHLYKGLAPAPARHRERGKPGHDRHTDVTP